MPLLLTLNICRIWFYCYYCLIRTNKCWLSLKKFFFNVFSNRWKYIALWPRKFAVLHVFFFIHPVKGYKRINFHIYIYIYIYIFPPGLELSLFCEGTTTPPPPFLSWVPLSFWSKFKKLPPSFSDPSKVVHANCKKHFKMKVLRFVPH